MCTTSSARSSFRGAAPSSGRFAATFSPVGRRGKRRHWRSPLPSGRGRIAPNCPCNSVGNPGEGSYPAIISALAGRPAT
ncbi:hypothetical protein EOA13_03440 [Mesorhizobium sp. M7A.F.Ca.US.011.01.1.1]|nr:hypothetical protein EOA13_03440 [Mesorhizobium sp. M7A.F.Ca.US.011.01.1.1]